MDIDSDNSSIKSTETQHHKSPCSICDEINSGTFPTHYQQYYGISNRICKETDRFVVLPSVSPLVAGHVLICPKSHFTSLSALSQEDVRELSNISSMIIQQITKDLDFTFIFEHGMCGIESNNCGITHAHLHILPLEKQIASRIDVEISWQFPPVRSGNVEHILKLMNDSSSYVIFGQDLSNVNISVSDEIPSQFIRKIIASNLGINNWDWKKLFGRMHFLKTYNLFAESDGHKASH